MTTLRDGHDLALRVMQYAEFHNLDLYAVNIRTDVVEASCDTFDHAMRLARGMDLWRQDARRHVHGRQVWLHSKWSGEGLLVVVNASLMAAGRGGVVSRILLRLRWRLAYLLDRSPRFCWADLVGLAQYGERERLTDLAGSGEACRAESTTSRHGGCYCGKFQNGCLRSEVTVR